MKLALGSAQFGMEYGIANQHGKVSLKEASSIISLCRLVGIDTVDTAMAYGDSEVSLGKLGTKDFPIGKSQRMPRRRREKCKYRSLVAIFNRRGALLLP